MLPRPQPPQEIEKASVANEKHFKFLTAIISGLFIQNVAIFNINLFDSKPGPILIYIALFCLLVGFYSCFRFSSDSQAYYNGLVQQSVMERTLENHRKGINAINAQSLTEEQEQQQKEMKILQERLLEFDSSFFHWLC